MRIPKPSRESRPRVSVKRGPGPRRRRAGGLAWAGRECDRIWSLLVRASNGGRCYFATNLPEGVVHVCAGAIQGAHGHSRRYRNTRWLLINGFPLCAAAHVMLTHNPLLWDDLLKTWWGESVYWELRRLAQSSAKVDVRVVLETLRAEEGA